MAASSSGMGWLAGAVVAAATLPLLSVGAGMPFWLAGIVSLLAGGGVGILTAPRKPFARLDVSGVSEPKIEFARELLTDAEPMAGRLEAAAADIRQPRIAERVRHLAGLARGIFAAIETEPLKIDRVRRFLTYYLPRAAEVAEAHAALERSVRPDSARIAAAGEMIDRLDDAFTRFAASLQDADLDRLDIELRLLKGSLDDDFGPARRSG